MTFPWEDTTSYRRGEHRGEVAPRMWTLRARELRVVVHRLHGAEGWYLSVHPGLRDSFALNATKSEDAKVEALGIVRRMIQRIADVLDDDLRRLDEGS